MKDFLEQLKIARDQISLSPEKKADLRAHLVDFMEAHPASLRVAEPARHTMQSGLSIIQLIQSIVLKPMPIALLLIVLLGGGTSFAAENTVPGDLLYPVKVRFNEEVRAAVALSPEAKLEWEARRAERRVEEAAKLVAKSELSEERKAEIDARIKLHTDRLELKLKELPPEKAERAADLASKFEVALKVHGRLFADAAVNATTSATTTEALKARIRTAVEKMIALRLNAEGEIGKSGSPGVKAAAEGKINAAENVLVSAKRFVESKKSQLGAEATAEAEVKLKAADELLIQAKAKLAAEVYAEAFQLASQAARAAHEAQFTIEARGRLNVDFRGHGTTTATSSRMRTESKTDVNFRVPGIDGRVKLDLGF